MCIISYGYDPVHKSGVKIRKQFSMHQFSRLFVVLLGYSAMAISAAANGEFTPVLEITTGISHDSSLVVEEIDFTRESGDEAVNLDARIAVEGEFANGLTADVSYSVADINYREIDQFDLNTHLLMSSLGYDIGRVNVGFTYYRADSTLDGADYLTLTSGSPTVSLFLAKRVYFQGGFASLDKDFNQNPARGANNRRFFASTYYFIDSTRHYFAFTFARRDEDANEREFDYSGNEMEFNWIKISEVFNRDLRLKLGAKMEERDYKTITVDDTTSQRRDRRQEFVAETTLDLSKRTFTGFSCRYTQNNSNQSEMEYDQLSAEIFVGFKI